MAETFKILTVEVDKAYTSISVFSVIYIQAHTNIHPHRNTHIHAHITHKYTPTQKTHIHAHITHIHIIFYGL